MKSAFGWTLLSQEALKRAETQLREDVQGVRDEIGFLALHQAYANRFFPGTSVLHTRLRYVLFIPWIYHQQMNRGWVRDPAVAIEREEIVLTGRLLQSKEDGVIGGRIYPKPTAQPASMIYWTALGTWRILLPQPNGAYPRRSSVHRVLGRRRARATLHDDDHGYLEEGQQTFASLPSPPREWNNAQQALNFSLSATEARFLRGVLLALPRSGAPAAQSLLSRLVEAPINGSTEMWDHTVLNAAEDEDRAPLLRASQTASLSAVGRAIYAALVEEMRARDDGLPTENIHRRALREVVSKHRDLALALDIDEVLADALGGVNESILKVLRETQFWLRRGRAPPGDLYQVYKDAEFRRKKGRARLMGTLAGRSRRLEWLPEEHPRAEPLHYRWTQVRRLLLDLRCAA